jgi:hypothetical protein
MAVGNSTGCWIKSSGQIRPSWINQAFGEIFPGPPQKHCIRKMSSMTSAFLWLLIRPILTYDLVAMIFWIQVSLLDSFLADWLYRCLVRFLGQKISGTHWGLKTWSEDHLLRFLMSTQTHLSDTHSHGYSNFGTVTCGVSDLLEYRVNERVGAFGTNNFYPVITF